MSLDKLFGNPDMLLTIEEIFINLPDATISEKSSCCRISRDLREVKYLGELLALYDKTHLYKAKDLGKKSINFLEERLKLLGDYNLHEASPFKDKFLQNGYFLDYRYGDMGELSYKGDDATRKNFLREVYKIPKDAVVLNTIAERLNKNSGASSARILQYNSIPLILTIPGTMAIGGVLTETFKQEVLKTPEMIAAIREAEEKINSAYTKCVAAKLGITT
jgi:hypothetical protein